jgi:RNA polymerase sigma-70 factor (ECF subfamily)
MIDLSEEWSAAAGKALRGIGIAGTLLGQRWLPPEHEPTRSTVATVETDVELLGRLRAGDEEAFMMLVSYFHQPMLRLAQSIVSNPVLAEDAVQDTWMGVVRGIDRFEGRSSFKTWLFRILVNRARSARSQEPFDVPLENLHSVDPDRFDSNGQWADPLEWWTDDAENRLDAAAWSPVLRGALGMLPDRQRQVVLLRDVEGLSNGEVCSVLGIGSGNQRILLHRGRTRLRDIIEDQMKKD